MPPLVPTTNISRVPQKLGDEWIAPGASVDIPFPLAHAYRAAPDFRFDFASAEADFVPCFDGDTLRGFAFATPLSMFDGYGLIGAYTAREFLRRGVDLDLYKSGWLIERDLFPDLLAQLQRPKQFYQLAIAKGPPPDVLDLIPSGTVVNYSMWESDRLPADWVPLLNNLPLVIVPTQAQVTIYRDSGVTVPIEVFPDPIDTDYWGKRTTKPDPDGPFTIVSWSRMTSRKMPIEMVLAFQQAFPLAQYPDIRFELKTNGGNFGGGKGVIPAFADPRIVVHDGAWPIDTLRDWVGRAHAAFFLSRGEGMGNCPMQAMALGVPSIVTNHTGHADFADPRYNWVVDLDEQAPLVESPMGPGMRWWNPSLEHAAVQLRAVYEDYAEAKRRATRGKKFIKDRYNVPRFADNFTETLRRLV